MQVDKKIGDNQYEVWSGGGLTPQEKQFIDELIEDDVLAKLNNKLDKNIDQDVLDRAYIATSSGYQTMYQVDRAGPTPNTLARRGFGGEVKVGPATQDEDATNKGYVDAAIAQAQLATHKWLPAVQTKDDLPDPTTLTATLNYLCRVINDTETPANNGVWELVAGAAEWTYFSDNADWIDPIELNQAIRDHNEDQQAHSALLADYMKADAVYIAANEAAARSYSSANPTVMVFYPET
jgi:hypothetical protein